MSRQAVLTLQLDVELHDAFMEAAKTSRQPASQILRDMMRDFISQQTADPDYLAFLKRKVEIARSQLASGKSLDEADIEQEFTARRSAVIAGGHSRT